MRDNYDRLVLELGVSPRGKGGGGGGSESVQLPRVPQSRHWEAGASRKKSPTLGSQSARSRPVGYGRKAKGAGDSGGPAQAVATARLLQKLDSMADSGQLSTTQAKRLRKLWTLQENVLTSAGQGGGDEESMLSAFTQILQYLEEPDAMGGLDVDPPPPAAPPERMTSPAEPAPSSTAKAEKAALQPEPPADRPRPGGPRPVSGGKGSVSAPTRSDSPPKPKSPPAPRPPSPPAAPKVDPEATAAFAKVEAMLAHSHTKIFELFKRMDADLDGSISAAELVAGFKSLGLEMTNEEVLAFFRQVEPSGASTTSLKALHKALRPGQSMKNLNKKSEEMARDAEGAITSEDMIADGLTEEEAAQMRAEAHLKAGRLPSLSPDEDDDGGGGQRSKGKGSSGGFGTEFVWNQLETRLAPDGVDKAPVWQREALGRVQWQVDLNRRSDRREAKLRYETLNPSIPSWDKPTRPSKKHLVERELRQEKFRSQAAEAAEAASSGMIMGGASTRSFGGASSAPAGTLSAGGGATDGTGALVGPNPARTVLDNMDPEDTSKAHVTWLRGQAENHEQATTQRVNKVAFYEQSLQQLQLQRQELESSLESAKNGIDSTQRSGKSSAIDSKLRAENFRRSRLKADLLEVQNKANTMQTSTQALMHVINSLRITRKRHVQRVGGLDEKERTMDNDAQFLLGSASGAMEERERLRAKHERLKHEAAAWKAMQLKEAAALTETIEELDNETRELEAKLQGLDEKETRLAYTAQRHDFENQEQRQLKYGYLRGQVLGWAAEFERVTSITGVRFGEGKSDAVDKVVSIYSANELRNKSLFKFVTEDVVMQTETLQVEVQAEEEMAAKLEAEQAAQDASDAAAVAKRIETAEAEQHLDERLIVASKAVEGVLPLVEKLGLGMMSAAEIKMPQHMEGKDLGAPNVLEFLALIEDSFGSLFTTASLIVAARAPPAPTEEEEEERKKSYKEPEPEPEVTPTLAVLRAVAAQRDLPQGKGASKMLHNDSSERLLPIG